MCGCLTFSKYLMAYFVVYSIQDSLVSFRLLYNSELLRSSFRSDLLVSYCFGILKNKLMITVSADTIVKVKIGMGSCKTAKRGERAEKVLEKVFTNPKAVAENRMGKMSA